MKSILKKKMFCELLESPVDLPPYNNIETVVTLDQPTYDGSTLELHSLGLSEHLLDMLQNNPEWCAKYINDRIMREWFDNCKVSITSYLYNILIIDNTVRNTEAFVTKVILLVTLTWEQVHAMLSIPHDQLDMRIDADDEKKFVVLQKLLTGKMDGTLITPKE